LDTKTFKKKLRLSYKKTSLIPGNCPNEITQYQGMYRIKTLTVLAEAGEFHLVFYDPTHKVHNTIPGYCWQSIGKEGTIVMPSNTGRKRITVLGFINAISLKFTSFITESNCDKFTVEIAHKELRKAYPDEKEIIVIQDNAPYNHAYAKFDSIKDLKITPLFLPTYCPNLNLIERIWKFMKNEIMRNVYYSTFNEFYHAIIDFCGNFKKYINEITSLISQKFQIFKTV